MEKQRIEYYASQIVDSGYRVHKELGPGLLESVYLFCLMEELTRRGIKAEQACSYSADNLVFKLSDKKLGFLINFNVPVFKEGIHRYVNKY